MTDSSPMTATEEMRKNGIYLELVDLQEQFNSLATPPLLVNDFNITSKEDKEQLNKLLFMSYEGDSLEALPSCDCGTVVGDYNIDILCKNCNTLCKPITERELESILWVKVPDEIDYFINPHVWIMLSDAMNDKIFNTLEYLTSPSYRCDSASHKKPKVEKLGIPRDINFFVQHFDAIIEKLREAKLLKDCDPNGYFANFLALNRDKLFTKYIPVPSKLNFITESTPTGKYADLDMGLMMDGIHTINAIEFSNVPVTYTMKVNRTVKAQRLIAQYYNDFYRKQLGKKTGWLRKHVFGGSLHFSFRAVISSISESHDKEECHLPWSVAVMTLKSHLTNLLLKRGMTPNQIMKFLYSNTLQYNSLLDELFQELINGSTKTTRKDGKKGIPIILQRNPSLQRGSAQRLVVTKIKAEPRDNTIGMSVNVLAAPNAD